MRKLRLALFLLLTLLAPAISFGVQPDEVLVDAGLETRARALSSQLRCMVCQNQSIDDSDAELAKDLRILVRERLVAGDSDVQVLDYLVSRYGEFVLLKPRLSAENLLLWATPAGILFIAGILWLAFARRHAAREAVRLTDDETARLQKLLADQD